jgi:hypothetical protein
LHADHPLATRRSASLFHEFNVSRFQKIAGKSGLPKQTGLPTRKANPQIDVQGPKPAPERRLRGLPLKHYGSLAALHARKRVIATVYSIAARII